MPQLLHCYDVYAIIAYGTNCAKPTRRLEMVGIMTIAVQDTVRFYREKLGMTIPELARKAGVSPVIIYSIENFKAYHSNHITTEVAEWIAKALGVTVQQVAWPCPIMDGDVNSE